MKKNQYKKRNSFQTLLLILGITISGTYHNSYAQKKKYDKWNLPEIVNVSESTKAKLNYKELKGKLPIRNTKYMIRVPENWNGILLNNLDYYKQADSPRSISFLEKGYALSGTQRRSDRGRSYDPAHEAHDFITIFDLFEATFGKPKKIIQLGCSGGGTVTLTMVEKYSDRIDGGIAGCAATSPWMANIHLDGLFVLKSLIAPELAIVNLANFEKKELAELGKKWKKALDKAQETPEGRARIALAITVGQWPAWGGRGDVPVPKPDSKDIQALQNSMYHSMVALLPNVRTRGTSMIERAGGGQIRSNVEADYAELFKNGNSDYVTAVKTLYKQAGLSLKKDFKKINAAPRIKSDPKALKFWSAPGRTHVGEPKVPLLRIHTSGDGLVYPVLAQGYEELVQKKGYSELFRSAYVNNWGHCMFSNGEWLAAIETMVQRLNTGVWPKTDPESMNKRSKKIAPKAAARYFDFKAVEKPNHVWLPSINDYKGVESPVSDCCQQ